MAPDGFGDTPIYLRDITHQTARTSEVAYQQEVAADLGAGRH